MRGLALLLLGLTACAGVGGGDEAIIAPSGPPKKRLYQKFLLGEDDSRLSLGIYDLKYDMECVFATMGGTKRCVPMEEATLAWDLSLDSTCRTPVFWTYACRRPARFTARTGVSVDACGGSAEVYQLVPVPAESLFQHTDAGCRPYAGDGTRFRYYKVGTRVSDEEFVAVQPALE